MPIRFAFSTFFLFITFAVPTTIDPIDRELFSLSAEQQQVAIECTSIHRGSAPRLQWQAGRWRKWPLQNITTHHDQRDTGNDDGNGHHET
jgi:hypothetical protein